MTLDEAFDVLRGVLNEKTAYMRDAEKKADENKRLKHTANELDELKSNAASKMADKMRNKAAKTDQITDQVNSKHYVEDINKREHGYSNRGGYICKQRIKGMYDVTDPAIDRKPGEILRIQKTVRGESADMLREACLTILTALDEE